jgi:hypothetical protein
MPKKFKCKKCQTEDSKEFYPNRKNICKKCIAENQRKDYEEKKELLEKLKAEESKPETPRARSRSPSSPENYETFRQAVLDLQAMINKQAQDFELYKVNADFKIQALETQIQNLESRPIIIPVSSPSSSSSSSEASPVPSRAPSRAPSPIRVRSKSPVKENPKKTEYKEMIQKINEDLSLFRKNKRPQNYNLKELEALCKTHKINRHGARNWDEVALAIISDLQNRINVC